MIVSYISAMMGRFLFLMSVNLMPFGDGFVNPDIMIFSKN